MQQWKRLPNIIAVLTLAVLTAACQSSGKVDKSGTAVQISESNALDPANATLNIASFFPPEFVTGITREVRDNIIPIDTYRVRNRGGNGTITTRHVRGDYRYNDLDSIQDESEFRALAKQGKIELRVVKRIEHRNGHVGYRGLGRNDTGILDCVIASTGYDLLGTTGFEAGSFDTRIIAYFCGLDIDPGMYDAMLTQVGLVTDRVAYRTALAARPAATTTPATVGRGADAATRAPTRNTLRLYWSGRLGLFDDTVEITYQGAGGAMEFVHPDGNTCRVTFIYQTVSTGGERGTWAGTCSDGGTATGRFSARGNGDVSGGGLDENNNDIDFTLSAPL